MHYPLDFIIMLGTNDAVIDFKATPIQPSRAIAEMIRHVKKSHLGQNFKAPNALLIAPVPIVKIDSADFDLFFNDEYIKKHESYQYTIPKWPKKKTVHF